MKFNYDAPTPETNGYPIYTRNCKTCSNKLYSKQYVNCNTCRAKRRKRMERAFETRVRCSIQFQDLRQIHATQEGIKSEPVSAVQIMDRYRPFWLAPCFSLPRVVKTKPKSEVVKIETPSTRTIQKTNEPRQKTFRGERSVKKVILVLVFIAVLHGLRGEEMKSE
ncbi:hypothetical protein K438DRAFT_1752713 [Mycena galopus ATCC 62051]|nr:hypothetical protein K438DRAFT_1752713 [Mycena galopus ATCC 62051]